MMQHFMNRHPTETLAEKRLAFAARTGFTVIELLVVIGIIMLLISIFAVTFGNTILTARERATQATILKIDGLLQQRIESFHRAVDKNLEQGVKTQAYINAVKRELGMQSADTTDFAPAMKILVRKYLYRTSFPQSFNISEMPSTHPLLTNPAYVSSNHQQKTESSACLYYVLTQARIFGAPPVSPDNFSSNEVRDTDGDGLLEFIDAWGEPLRFYRSPTALLRNAPNTSAPPDLQSTSAAPSLLPSGKYQLIHSPPDVQRLYGKVLMPNLQPDARDLIPPIDPDAPKVDALAIDPDDAYGRISAMLSQVIDPTDSDPQDPPSMRYNPKSTEVSRREAAFRNRYHHLDTFFSPLILSAGGGDSEIGLFEPYATAPVNAKHGLPIGYIDGDGASLLNDISNYNSRR
jgi:type II secretory pathway pseudopilin PulG